jgi:pimeloyl-ACP methyl ester carboxylesterase
MIKRGYANGPFGQIHFEQCGDGVPVVLFHQMVQSTMQFSKVLPILARSGVRAISVDLPGYGMSDVPSEPPSIDDYASLLPALLEHLNLHSTAVAGHHTGASVAISAATCYSNIVNKLVLHGVPYYSVGAMKERASKPHHDKQLMNDGAHLEKIWNLFYGAGDGNASLEVTHKSILNYFSAGEKEWYGHNAVYTHDIWNAIKAVNVPSLLISNTGDMLNPQDQELAKARPDFIYHEIEGGTFQYIYDDAEDWARIVLPFLLD